jgi:hypothetical protein
MTVVWAMLGACHFALWCAVLFAGVELPPNAVATIATWLAWCYCGDKVFKP